MKSNVTDCSHCFNTERLWGPKLENCDHKGPVNRFSEQNRQWALLWYFIISVWRSWRNSPHCDVTDVNYLPFIFFQLYCLSSNCCVAACLKPALLLCLEGNLLIFTCPPGPHKRNLIWPNNVKSSCDMYQAWTCKIRSIMRQVTSVIDFQYPLPNTCPSEFSQLSV